MKTDKTSARKRTLPFAIPLAVVVGAALWLNACSHKNSQAAERARDGAEALPVRLVSVQPTQAALPIRAMGALATKDEARLSFKIGGVVESVTAREGESVRKGQTLASLNLAEINAHLTQAREAFEKAQRDWERAKSLQKDGAATVEQLQNATSGYEAAKAALQIAQFNRAHAVIIAPMGGKVLKTLAKAGEVTGAGMPVVVVSSETSGWVVRVGLSDRDIVRLRAGDKALVRFDAFPGETFEATTSELAAAANPANGTFEAELRVKPKAQTRFVTGLAASVEITPSAQEHVVLLPIEALSEANGMEASVYAVNENAGAARKIPVRIAFLQGASVAVRQADLRDVAAVVAEGAAYLSDGAPVKVVR